MRQTIGWQEAREHYRHVVTVRDLEQIERSIGGWFRPTGVLLQERRSRLFLEVCRHGRMAEFALVDAAISYLEDFNAYKHAPFIGRHSKRSNRLWMKKNASGHKLAQLMGLPKGVLLPDERVKPERFIVECFGNSSPSKWKCICKGHKFYGQDDCLRCYMSEPNARNCAAVSRSARRAMAKAEYVSPSEHSWRWHAKREGRLNRFMDHDLKME